MAESEEDYVQRRFRDWKPPTEGWTRPDKFDRPPQFEGLDGGGNSHSLPIVPVASPIVNGNGGANGGGSSGSGTTFDVIVNGARFQYSFVGSFV